MKSLTVSRLEQYPADEPSGWAVGLVCVCDNDRSFYTDCTIGFDKASTDGEAVAEALLVLKDSVESQCAAMEDKSVLLGSDVSGQL